MQIMPVLKVNIPYDLMILRGIFFLWASFLFLNFVYRLFEAVRSRKGYRELSLLIVPVVICFLITIFAEEGILLSMGTEYVIGIAVVLVVMTILSFVQLAVGIRNRKRCIDLNSVKESVDKLVTGVCCYFEDGRIKLHNLSMEGIWRSLTGQSLVDGRSLWSILSEGQAKLGTCIKDGDNPIYELHDGNVRSFRRTYIETDGMRLYEVLAADVTEEFALISELEEKEERLRYRGSRLKALGEKIDALNIEKEILNSKIRLHDDWGRALLTAKAYMENPDDETRREFLSIWERNISYVEENEPSLAKDAYDDIIRSAEALGLRIDIEGELPEDYDMRNVVIQAMTVCLSNMVKHAEGKLLELRSENSSGRFTVTLTNDGESPDEVIEEKGGLKNLRKKVEAQGWQMKVESSPRFVLNIEMGDKNGI